MEPWAELIELYEYKVADVVAGRDPRGGRRSLVALRDTLLYGSLDSTLLRRFRHADRLWRDYAVVAAPREVPGTALSAEALEDWSLPSSAPPDAEGEVLRKLGEGLWRVRLDDHLARLAARWRRESGLVTLRALYALSLNLDSGKLAHNVPDEHDPLVSLGNPQIALGMLGGLVDQLLEHTSDTLTPVAWARSMLLELAQNPFPNVAAASLSADERGALPGRTTERTQIREALGRGFDTIAGLLPPKLGGGGDEPPAILQALFARTPERRQPQPDDASTTLAVRLAGSGKVHWHDHVLGWQNVGGEWQLLASGAVYPLRREERGVGVTRVPLDGRELRALVKHDYLLLDLEQTQGASLPDLVALGWVVAALLEDADNHLHLRLARGVAQWLRDGRFELGALGPESAAKYAAATQDSLLAFARKGAENLLARLGRSSDVDVTRAFREVARALSCPEERAIRLLDVLREAREARPPVEVGEVRGEREVVLLAYQGDPITVTVVGRALTLRADYRGEVTAVLPGAPALPVRALQVFSLPQGSVVVARQGLRLAVTYQAALAR